MLLIIFTYFGSSKRKRNKINETVRHVKAKKRRTKAIIFQETHQFNSKKLFCNIFSAFLLIFSVYFDCMQLTKIHSSSYVKCTMEEKKISF